MKITALKAQVRDKNRVNVFVDGSYRFSLEIAQVIDLGIKTNNEYTEEELLQLEIESQYGKVYARALEYVFVRPRSQRELRDYLRRKMLDKRDQHGNIRRGISPELADRVFDRLVDKGHLNDTKFATFWIENRNLRKGISERKLRAELMAKGVASQVIDEVMRSSERDEGADIQSVIKRKINKYAEDRKLIEYLARQGFSYDVIVEGLRVYRESEESD